MLRLPSPAAARAVACVLLLGGGAPAVASTFDAGLAASAGFADLPADAQTVARAVIEGADMPVLCQAGATTITEETIRVTTDLASAGKIGRDGAMAAGGATAGFWPQYCRALLMAGGRGQ